MSETNLVLITFGVLVLKERNPKKVRPKQNGAHQRNT